MSLPRVASVSVALVIGLTACHRDPEPEGRSSTPTPPGSGSLPPEAFLAPAAARPSAAAAALAAPAAPARPLAWTDPQGWTRVPSTSAMRLAQYRVPHAPADAEDAEMTVFHFGAGQGGTVDANFARWQGQFGDTAPERVHRSRRTVNGLTEHVLEVEEGTYSGGMGPATPTTEGKKRHGMLAAIVETPDGPYFFKLSGPTRTVAGAKNDFMTMLDSMKL